MVTSESVQSTLENGLPNINRYITTTTRSEQAVFSTTIPSPSTWQAINNTTKFFLGYTTRAFPVQLSRSQTASDATPDIATYQADIATPPGISISDGTVMRYVDMAPGTLTPMHYTKSLDYGIVLEGEVELLLDSGEKRVLRRCDSAVQRGTYHAWRNVSDEGKWARMVFVLVGAEGEGLEKEFAVKEDGEKSE
jgi:quercetin dioxygenase-like cupin family protein